MAFPVEFRLASGEADGDVLLHVHVGEEQGLLGHHVNPLGQGGGGPVQDHFLPPDAEAAAVMGVDAHDNFHQCGFPGAVAADQGQDLAGHQIQIDALENLVHAEGLVNSADREQRRSVPGPFRRCHINSPIPSSRFSPDFSKAGRTNVLPLIFLSFL